MKKCKYQIIDKTNGKYKCKCTVCGHISVSKFPPQKINRKCKKPQIFEHPKNENTQNPNTLAFDSDDDFDNSCDDDITFTQDNLEWYDQPLIVVVGIHRTLSSCLATCLQKLGIYMGGPTVGGEDKGIMKICEKLVPFPAIKKEETFEKRVEKLRFRILKIREQSNGKLIGIKYPTLCNMLPELKAAWPNLKIIHIARPLDQSINSLNARSQRLSQDNWAYAIRDQCEALQAYLFDKKEQWLANHEHLTVSSNVLVRNPSEEINRVVKYLENIGLKPTSQQIQNAINNVNPKAVKYSQPLQSWLDDTTIIIKSHERPACLHDLITSIHKYYPEAKILVGDDSKDLIKREDVKVFHLPYDVGLSAGRNYLVNKVQTKYLLLLDDDALLFEQSNIQALYERIKEVDFDAVSGKCISRKMKSPFNCYLALENEDLILKLGPYQGHGKWAKYHMIENCLIAKTESFRKLKWDNRLKVGEHLDWALRACKLNMKFGHLPSVIIFDQSSNTTNTSLYSKHRNRAIKFRNMSLVEWMNKIKFTRFIQELPKRHPKGNSIVKWQSKGKNNQQQKEEKVQESKVLSQDMFSKSKRYLNERQVWAKAGKPFRSDEETEQIFSQLCKSCEYFDKKNENLGRCKICGCFLKPKGKNFNKIAWATTSCPHDPPKWTTQISVQNKPQEQNMWQEQDQKQKGGLNMKTSNVNQSPQKHPPKKKPCGCGK